MTAGLYVKEWDCEETGKASDGRGMSWGRAKAEKGQKVRADIGELSP